MHAREYTRAFMAASSCAIYTPCGFSRLSSEGPEMEIFIADGDEFFAVKYLHDDLDIIQFSIGR